MLLKRDLIIKACISADINNKYQQRRKEILLVNLSILEIYDKINDPHDVCVNFLLSLTAKVFCYDCICYVLNAASFGLTFSDTKRRFNLMTVVCRFLLIYFELILFSVSRTFRVME